jgi:hypothetical protein
MKYFFFNLFKSYILQAFSIWMSFLLIIFLFNQLFDEQIAIFYLQIGLLTSIFATTVSMNLSRWHIFWRRTASTIKEFWLGIFAVQLFNLGFNGIIFFTIAKYYSSIESTNDSLFPFTFFDLIWIFLITFSFSITCIYDIKVMQTKTSLRPFRQIFLMLGLFIWIPIVAVLFVYSPLLSYLTIEISILFFFIKKNHFIFDSIQKTVRHQLLIVGTLGILGLWISSYLLALKELPDSDSQKLLGHLGPQKKVEFLDLNSIDKPSLWLDWRKQAGKLNAEQTILALAKLEDLCPPQPTDTPIIIECFEKNLTDHSMTYYYSFKDVDIYNTSDVIQLLRDPHIYSKLFGLIAARNLDEFTPDITDAISELAGTGGRLAPVAELTLSSHKKDQQCCIKIFIERKK